MGRAVFCVSSCSVLVVWPMPWTEALEGLPEAEGTEDREGPNGVCWQLLGI